jgi:hypothetical protein
MRLPYSTARKWLISPKSDCVTNQLGITNMLNNNSVSTTAANAFRRSTFIKMTVQRVDSYRNYCGPGQNQNERSKYAEAPSY